MSLTGYKKCPECKIYIDKSWARCPNCGHSFEVEKKNDEDA